MSTPLSAPSGPTIGSGLPTVNQALEPASVRNGSPARQQAYARALDFEAMLVQQLSQSLAATSGLSEEAAGGTAGGAGEEGGSGATSALGGAAGGGLSSLLPEALSNGVMSHGGLGLATQLMGALEPGGSAASAATTSPVAANGGQPAVVGGAVEPAQALSAAGGVSA